MKSVTGCHAYSSSALVVLGLMKQNPIHLHLENRANGACDRMLRNLLDASPMVDFDQRLIAA